MSNPRYPEEFKIQAVNQVTEKKLPVAEVAARLGVSTLDKALQQTSRRTAAG
jgi:transposase